MSPENFIFRLNLYIFRLKMHIFRLNLYIFRLKMDFCGDIAGFSSRTGRLFLADRPVFAACYPSPIQLIDIRL